MLRSIFAFSLFFTINILFAQQGPSSIFQDIKISTRFATSGEKNWIEYNGQPYLSFYYESYEESAELLLLPSPGMEMDSTIRIMPTSDYEILDPLAHYNNGYHRAKIRFSNLNNPSQVKILFQKLTDSVSYVIEEILLFPTTKTEANFFPQNKEVFLGEELIYEVFSNQPENIKVSTQWTQTGAFDYRLSREFNKVSLHLIARKPGNQELSVKLPLFKPHIDSAASLNYQLEIAPKNFMVKQSRLSFLETYAGEVTFNERNRKEGFEIQIDDASVLTLGKTYRLENQEEPGGALIAEFFTTNRLSNNRMMGLMRVYNLHRQSEGFLYLKDGDKAISLTNIDITPESKISQIQVMHEGENWSGNLSVKPGETVRVGIVGEGLHKSNFYWDGVEDITPDTVLRTEKYVFFVLKVPVNITLKNIVLYNKGEAAGYHLTLKEFQRPRDFDFITLNYGTGDKVLSTMGGPIIHDKVIKDIVLDFNRNIIDENNVLYGKQYFDIDIKITGPRNELIELKTIRGIAICPGELSPRHSNYFKSDCHKTALSLNKYLKKKTYDLDDWVKIELTFRHEDEKYAEPIISQDLDIIVQKPYRFDIDVSFPAGLIIKRFGPDSDGIDNFGGISMAMIAQFSFYDPERIGKFKPYKIGAGFLALNAFNFNENASRDIAIVVLGSLYPTRKDLKLTFPLYFGGGYFLGDKKLFVLVGPGIRISL